MGIPDETIRDAVRKAQTILAQDVEPDGPNDSQTIKQLFRILNDPAVIAALQEAEQAAQKPQRRRRRPIPPLGDLPS
jgi:hypothetical protein